MSYKQVHDVLDEVKRFHSRLRKAYTELTEETEDEELKLLLKAMCRHERYVEDALADYRRDATDGILNTWIQFVPDEAMRQAFDDVKLRPGMSRQEVLESAMRFDQALAEVYDTLAVSQAVPRVQEVFARLAEMVRKKEYQHAWTALDLPEEKHSAAEGDAGSGRAGEASGAPP